MLRSKPECRSLSEPDYSERRAACHQRCSDLRQSRSPGGTSSLVEREEIALLKVQGHSMQEIGRRLGRSASTISRELRRNAATRSGGLEYRATTAQWHAESIGPSAQTDQACAQHNLAHLCGGETCWRRRGPERRSRSWSRRSVEGPPAWPAKGSAMGQGLESRADCPTLADRLPGRQDDAHQPRSYLSGPLRSGPGGATPRTDGLLANRARVTECPGRAYAGEARALSRRRS